MSINRFFEQYRQFGIVLIISLPLMDTLDKSLLDLEVVRFMIHIDSRGKTQNNCRVYSLHRMFYLKEKMKGLMQKSFAYKIVRCNFFCHINRLPPAVEKEVEAFSLVGKKKELLSANILANDLVSYQMIADKLHKSLPWVRIAIAQLKIKPKQKLSKANYYNKEILDTLVDYTLKH